MSNTKEIQSYENAEIKVGYDPNVCAHAGECVKGLPQVFNPEERPWIKVDAADAKSIAATIHKCPTGALSYELAGAEIPAIGLETEDAVEISVLPNGPLGIFGDISIKSDDGSTILEADKAYLCRCGYSSKKPFCDGSHKREGWVG